MHKFLPSASTFVGAILPRQRSVMRHHGVIQRTSGTQATICLRDLDKSAIHAKQWHRPKKKTNVSKPVRSVFVVASGKVYGAS